MKSYYIITDHITQVIISNHIIGNHIIYQIILMILSILYTITL